MNSKITQITLLSLASLFVWGCAKTSSSGANGWSGQVKVAMTNTSSASTSQGLLGSLSDILTQPRFYLNGTSAAATAFGVKLKFIYLIEDQENATADTNYLGNNVGNSIFIWSNPGCTSRNDTDCTSIDYFQLEGATEHVNQRLNSQHVDVTAGTYKYIKLGLLGEQQGGNNNYENTRWSYTPGITDTEFASIQTEWAAKFDPPLTIEEGDSLTVNLSYSLDNIVYTNSNGSEKQQGQGTYQPEAFDDCEGTSPKTCILFPALTVSAAKD
jgi:hypothetical protein